MQNPFLPLLLLLFIKGVFGADETVMEGDSVTLQTNVTEIQNDDVIMWNFGPQNMFLCQITRKDGRTPISLTDDVSFRGRLQVDPKTGSLTIRNTRITHSGDYTLSISREQIFTNIFKVTVKNVVGKTGGVKSVSVSVKEGKSVTLKTDVEVQRDDLIVWRFGDEGILLAKIDVETKEASLNEADETFRDRLKIDHQSGSLTITSTKTEHSGLYEIQIRGRESSQRFLLSVNAVPSSGPSPIVGIVVAVLLAVAAVAVAVIYIRYRRSEREKQMDSMKPKTVKCEEGECAVLWSCQEIKKGDKMLWTLVSGKESAIASMSKNDKKTYWYDERFRGRLQLDPRTGSLIISNLRKTDAGVYFLEIKNRGGTAYRKYKVSLSDEVETETVSVKEGDDVTLDFPKESGNSITWSFGDDYFITSLIENDKDTQIHDGRFRGRLQLDKQKGSLTIKNIRPEHTGVYKASKPGNNCKKFSVVLDDFTETSENESVITGFLGRIQRFCGQARIEGVFGDEKDEMKTLSVMKEVDLKLNTETEIETDDEIILRFGSYFRPRRPYVTIARFSKQGEEFKSEERDFNNRLQWNLTGPLTITIPNFRNAHCGDYYVQITNKKKKSFKSFTFIVVPNFAVKSVLVMEGESINLVSPITVLQEEEQMLWTFGRHDMIIIADTTNTSRCDERFGDRVKLDKTTGSLIISNSTTADEGYYNLRIISGNRVIHQRFNVTVYDIAVKSEPVMEGESINVVSPITALHKDDQVLWTFGRHGMIIADTTNTRCDERFKDRVTLGETTRSLTIIKSTTADDGLYNVQIISGNRVIHQTFYVTVYGPLLKRVDDNTRVQIPDDKECDEDGKLLNVQEATCSL